MSCTIVMAAVPLSTSTSKSVKAQTKGTVGHQNDTWKGDALKAHPSPVCRMKLRVSMRSTYRMPCSKRTGVESLRGTEPL